MKLFSKQTLERLRTIALTGAMGLVPINLKNPPLIPLNATFTVSTTNPTGANSLYAAIQSANQSVAVNVTINFNITQQVPLPGHIIQLARGYPLPPITRSMTINASTEGWPIIIDGRNLGDGSTGFTVDTSNCTIEGFTIDNFTTGILVENGTLNVIESNTINSPDGDGIDVVNAKNNTIGGPLFIDGNRINNDDEGYAIALWGSTSNHVQYNILSSDVVGIWLDPTSNTNPVVNNTISNSATVAIEVQGQNNYIGFTPSNGVQYGNTITNVTNGSGIVVFNTDNNIIDNDISGCQDNGIYLGSTGVAGYGMMAATYSYVAGNDVIVTPGNQNSGIYIDTGADHCQVGPVSLPNEVYLYTGNGTDPYGVTVESIHNTLYNDVYSATFGDVNGTYISDPALNTFYSY